MGKLQKFSIRDEQTSKYNVNLSQLKERRNYNTYNILKEKKKDAQDLYFTRSKFKSKIRFSPNTANTLSTAPHS